MGQSESQAPSGPARPDGNPVQAHPHGHRQADIDAKRLIDALHLQHIQMEMQNEELCRAQQEVEAALQRYTDLYDFAPVGYFTIDRNKVIRQVNLAGASLLGVRRDRVVGGYLSLYVSAADRARFNAFLDTLFTGQPSQEIEVSLPADGDDATWVAIRADAPEDGHHCRLAMSDITKRVLAEKALQAAHDTLEQEVAARTRLLNETVARLSSEVSMHRETTRQLLRDKEELRNKSQELFESNTALKVMLRIGYDERSDMKNDMHRDIIRRLTPLLERLKKSTLLEKQISLVQLIETNIFELASPATSVQSVRLTKLTTTEISVANLIKQGKATKEIAELLDVSSWTVNTHRKNIRKKLGIQNVKQPLKKTLFSLL